MNNDRVHILKKYFISIMDVINKYLNKLDVELTVPRLKSKNRLINNHPLSSPVYDFLFKTRSQKYTFIIHIRVFQ